MAYTNKELTELASKWAEKEYPGKKCVPLSYYRPPVQFKGEEAAYYVYLFISEGHKVVKIDPQLAPDEPGFYTTEPDIEPTPAWLKLAH